MPEIDPAKVLVSVRLKSSVLPGLTVTLPSSVPEVAPLPTCTMPPATVVVPMWISLPPSTSVAPPDFDRPARSVGPLMLLFAAPSTTLKVCSPVSGPLIAHEPLFWVPIVAEESSVIAPLSVIVRAVELS